MTALLGRPLSGAHNDKIETLPPDRRFGGDGDPRPQPTVERERLYRKQRSATGCRLFARRIASQFGTEVGGIVSFQPYWSVISEAETGLFD